MYRWFWHRLQRITGFVQRQREWIDVSSAMTTDTALKTLIPDLTVQHGPFRGMQYPASLAVGSSLFPKLIGSYERELHHIIDEALGADYTDVIDIGCAEGYYAVGFALRSRAARVFAFDIDESARAQCQAMARLNGVAERVIVERECDQCALRRVLRGRRGFVISDCEGFEKQLFDDEAVRCLENHDVLIEVHDFRDSSISETLLSRFRDTHEVTVIRSLNDRRRAEVFAYSELMDLSYDTRLALLAEWRPADMEWLLFRSMARR